MLFNCKAAPIVFIGLAFATPRTASACHEVTVCFAWPADVEDDALGEQLVVGEKVPAYGAWVTLIRPPPEAPFNHILDEEGCLTFETQFTFGHTVIVHAEAWFGTTDRWNLRVFHKNLESNFPEFEDEPRSWAVPLLGIAQNEIVNVDMPAESATKVMAITTAVMKRFVELDVLPSASPPENVLRVDYDPFFDGAGADPGASRILVGSQRHKNKHVMAHEMGHWLQDGHDALPMDGSQYNYGESGVPKVPDPSCVFFDGVHALRSAEWSTPAMTEGFAHFIASVVWNDHLEPDAEALFRYYKTEFPDPSVYQDLIDDKYLVSLPGGAFPSGGPKRWMDSECSDDWALEGVSSEIDWLRFFWYFVTQGDEGRPNLGELLAILSGADSLGPDKKNIWSKIVASTSSILPQFLSRLEGGNDEMGVYNAAAMP